MVPQRRKTGRGMGEVEIYPLTAPTRRLTAPFPAARRHARLRHHARRAPPPTPLPPYSTLPSLHALSLSLMLPLFHAAMLGHASMIMPPSRNSIDAELPAWSHGKHPYTGWIEPYSCTCTNGTEAECNSGQSCFWFSQGCTLGCKACDGDGRRFPSYDHCPGEPSALKMGTYLDKRWWTANHNATPGSYEDIWRFNPWRAPGHAPVWDACGMAGGSPKEVFNAGAYNTTVYAKIGDLGSKVLKPRPTGTVWVRGSVAKARWQLTARHGGGYQYRLCPAGSALTEACFQKTPLEFANPKTHRVLFKDSTREVPATLVSDGPAKGWMRMPLPNFDTHPCDYKVAEGKHCHSGCPACRAPWFADDDACPINCAAAFPGLPKVARILHPLPNPLPSASTLSRTLSRAPALALTQGGERRPLHLPRPTRRRRQLPRLRR